ncbi:hypothetical protein WH95_18535 [Kiloniella litopenaei]|uniref:ATP-dependent Clp protease proteolytic subunit n=1 Tax=Kiloniella litopenaei TaxID=1549748 RepID=A0A0M2R4R9_9PROT|nr:head maturation protease, ClpP-related [Kiloniella litopenaei]KKJ75439.1 hypothetical protein WH95_18535 [Kiloniella litopenaei]
MSLKKLPEIKAFDSSIVRGWIMKDEAIDGWNPAVKAADSDNTTITMLDVIGDDPFSGGGVTAKRISAALRSIGEQDITVELNSPGGDFFEGITIYNMLREHKGRVTVKILGIAASAASVIAMAGDDIEISESGFLMIHNAWSVFVGNRHDLRGAADTLEPFDTAMAELYAKRSGESVEVTSEWMDNETYFNGKEAVEAGLATSLLESDQIEQDETQALDAKAIRASIKLDNALRAHKPDMTRSERRALLGDVKGSKLGATVTVTPCADDISLSLMNLANSIR